jgi:hypothetical protein
MTSNERPEEVTKNLEINGQRRRLVLVIEAGNKTCAHAYGKFCPSMIHTLTGEAQCHLFGVPLYAFEDGSLKGWTARCDECLRAEREEET